MSEKKQKCIFGDEYGDCPVIPELRRQFEEQMQALKLIETDDKVLQDLRVVMREITTTILSYSYSLSQFCQACSKIPRNVMVLDYEKFLAGV